MTSRQMMIEIFELVLKVREQSDIWVGFSYTLNVNKIEVSVSKKRSPDDIEYICCYLNRSHSYPDLFYKDVKSFLSHALENHETDFSLLKNADKGIFYEY